jgi:hypothetical protein
MAKTALDKILQSPDKHVGQTSGANGVLANLFRKMLKKEEVNIPRWGSLMGDFITDVRNGVPNNKKDQTSIRGNLTKEFARPQMTWKVFCKALRFLQVIKFELVINAHFGRGKSVSYYTTVDLGQRNQNIHHLLDDLETEEPDEPDELDEYDEPAEMHQAPVRRLPPVRKSLIGQQRPRLHAPTPQPIQTKQ